MVRRRLAPSRSAAQQLIAAGGVRVGGIAEPKPATQVSPDQPIEVTDTGPRFASRGGLKLNGALDDLGVDPAGLLAMDAGAAHGGFTDVLLRRGAAHVIAVDVAYGQMAWALRTDPRVSLLERTNVRHLTLEDLGSRRPQLLVADLSFISLCTVLPPITALLADDAVMLPMVKPQFEVGAGKVGKGGVVRDPDLWMSAMMMVAGAAAELGFSLHGAAPSRAPGPAGNIEFFLHLRRAVPTTPPSESTAVGPTADADGVIGDAARAGAAMGVRHGRVAT